MLHLDEEEELNQKVREYVENIFPTDKAQLFDYNQIKYRGVVPSIAGVSFISARHEFHEQIDAVHGGYGAMASSYTQYIPQYINTTTSTASVGTINNINSFTAVINNYA